ncbi:MAG: class I SAM-dependent methyltransferase [Chloroflexi bacterium]|nr:class I SAM-dependent methyltransferase [Chloroflexota bacterium]
MRGYQPVMSFGPDVAQGDRHALRGDEDDAVAFLKQLAGDGPALELGIGSGRIALPLAAQGVRVDGVDLSPAMLDQLRARPGGAQLALTLGDLAEVPVTGAYRLIYVVWNTLFNLLTQEDELRCFANVAAHLAEGGHFVVEVYTPAFLYRLRDDQYVNAEAIEVDQVRLDLLRHDAARQIIEESHVSLSAAGIRLNPVVQRHAWPSELDLMARLAGLRLRERWGNWRREPFTSASEMHVSVYGW